MNLAKKKIPSVSQVATHLIIYVYALFLKLVTPDEMMNPGVNETSMMIYLEQFVPRSVVTVRYR